MRTLAIAVAMCAGLLPAFPQRAGDAPCPKCTRISDGRTWNGWERDEQNWTIVGGAMRGFGPGARSAFTTKDYGSFRLTVTSRMAPVNKDHLGILFSGPRPADGTLAYSRHIQVQPPHGAMWGYRDILIEPDPTEHILYTVK